MARWASRITNWSHLARSSEFSSEQLALHLGISQRQLQRHFRDIFRLELRKWLTSVRLFDARHLLGTQRSVKEVAYLLRYKQASHFSREFKRQFGISPEAFSSRSNWVGNPQFETTYLELSGDMSRLDT